MCIRDRDIIYALDAIATPMSLFEPVYQDGNDPLFLMDQICDKKNKEETWVAVSYTHLDVYKRQTLTKAYTADAPKSCAASYTFLSSC